VCTSSPGAETCGRGRGRRAHRTQSVQIERPTVVPAAGVPPKPIEEFVGRANTGTTHVSLDRMVSPSDWVEPGQRPELEELTLVLRGSLRVEHEGGVLEVAAGQAVDTQPGEWVRYSTPGPEGAEYVAICLPAFAPETVHRDARGSGRPAGGVRPPLDS